MFNSNLTSSITGWFSNTFQNKEETLEERNTSNESPQENVKNEENMSQSEVSIIYSYPALNLKYWKRKCFLNQNKVHLGIKTFQGW